MLGLVTWVGGQLRTQEKILMYFLFSYVMDYGWVRKSISEVQFSSSTGDSFVKSGFNHFCGTVSNIKHIHKLA